AEAEGEKEPVASGDIRRAQDDLPVAQHPFPAFRRVEPTQRRAPSAAGLVASRVAIQGKSKIGSVRRRRRLIGGQLGFGREWAITKKILPAGSLGRDPRCSISIFGGVKGVGRKDGPQQRLELLA